MKTVIRKLSSKLHWLYPIYYYTIGCIKDYFVSIPYLYRLYKNRGKNEIYILTNPPIGDTVYCLAYLDAFKRNNPDKTVVLIGYKNRTAIYNLYESSFDRIEYVDSDSNRVGSILRRKGLIKFIKRFNIYTTYPYFYKKVPFNSGETTLDVIKNELLSLPDNAQITFPTVPQQSVTSIENFNEIKDRVVVINPYSVTVRGMDLTIFNNITEFLTAQGYIVYTNALDNQEIIPNTRRLNCSIYEFYEMCNSIPLVISTRSGIIDFLISSSSKFYVIYFNVETGGTRWLANPINHFYNYFRLEAWGTNNVVEHIHRNNNESLNHFIEYFNTFIKNGN